jgi:hypothetical protein
MYYFFLLILQLFLGDWGLLFWGVFSQMSMTPRSARRNPFSVSSVIAGARAEVGGPRAQPARPPSPGASVILRIFDDYANPCPFV